MSRSSTRPPLRTSSDANPASATAPLMHAGTGTHAAFEASLEFFLAPLVPFFRDEQVNEIMVNGHEKIYIERAGKTVLTTAKFPTEADVQAAANNIAQFVGQPLSTERPLLDGRLPDGSRVCIVLGNLASAGTHINIRRFARNTASTDFLLNNKSITPMAMEFLLLAVKGHRNIIVSGGAGAGKTTAVNVLTTGFGEDERIVVIEDTRELQVQRSHVVQLEARGPDAYGRGAVTVRDLFMTALRMRPDRIVVGEVRRGEALDMIQALTSGHHGSLTTVHASSPRRHLLPPGNPRPHGRHRHPAARPSPPGRQCSGPDRPNRPPGLRPPPRHLHQRGRFRRIHAKLSDHGHLSFPRRCRRNRGNCLDRHPPPHFAATKI